MARIGDFLKKCKLGWIGLSCLMFQMAIAAYGQNAQEINALDITFQNNLRLRPEHAFQMAKDLLVEAVRDSSKCKESIARYYMSAVYLRRSEFPKSLFYASESLKAAKLSGDSLQISNSYNILGNVYEAIGNSDSALFCYQSSLDLGKLLGRNKAVARSLLNIAIIYRGLGMFPESLSALLESLEISKANNFSGYYPNVYLTIGEVYLGLGDLEAASENYHLGLHWANRVHNQKHQCRALLDLGTLNLSKGDTMEAMCWFESTIEISKLGNLPSIESKAAAQLALIYSGLGKNAAANLAASRAIEIGLRDNDRMSLGSAYQVKGLLELQAGDAQAAQKNCLKAYDIAKETQQTTVFASLCECLWKSAEKLGNYKAAFTYYRAFENWQDSLSGDENALGVARIESKMAYERKFLEDSIAQVAANAQKEVAFQIERTQKAFREKVLLWVGSFLIIAAGIVMFIFRRQNRQLKHQNLRIQEQNESIRNTLGEKDVLLSEVHHRVKNNLQVMSSLLEMQASGNLNGEAREILLKSQSRVQAMAMIHQLLYQEGSFAKINFGEYLLQLTASLMLVYDPNGVTQMEIVAEDCGMSPELAVSMGLVANELISNAFKHAFLPESHLGKLKVSFVGTGEDAFQLVVEDNGSNFDATLLKREDHRLGLRLVKGLVRQMKGEASLEMSILGGSKFTVNVIKAS